MSMTYAASAADKAVPFTFGGGDLSCPQRIGLGRKAAHADAWLYFGDHDVFLIPRP